MMRRRQHGAVLIAMLAVLIMGAAWWMVTAVNRPLNRTAEERVHNARILQEAKTALIGHVAYQLTAPAGENNPGRLPCPEAAASIGGANEGIASGNCTLPAVGRLPWRTLGLDKWRDAAGEPLWYVVSPAWALSNATVPALTTFINSNSTGMLTLDGTADVVALIIAPGRPLAVQASANCLARVQRRTTPGPLIDWRDYLECQNGDLPADTGFTASGPDGSFNDQVLALTGAELLPFIEAAVASRVERQFGPQMRTAYSGGLWPATPALPFAAQFSNPTVAPGNQFRGALAQTQGLLPANYAGTCVCLPLGTPAPCTCTQTACPADTRCDQTFVTWSNTSTVTRIAGANLHSASCAVAGTPSTLTCTINVWTDLLTFLVGGNWMTFDLRAVANNAGMTFRTINNPTSGIAPAIGGIDTTFVNNPFGYQIVAPVTAPAMATAAQLNANGSATININARVPAFGGTPLAALGGVTCAVLGIPVCYQHVVTLPMALFTDHPVVDANNASFNWFYRNGWHLVSSYAVAPEIAPSGARVCAPNCFTVNFRNPTTGHRGLIAIGGRAFGAQARPPVLLSDLLDDTNNNNDAVFAARVPTLMINRTFNDHIAVVDP